MEPLTLHAALSPVHHCPLLAAGLLLPQVSAAGRTMDVLGAEPRSGLPSDLFAGACCPICASMLQILWNKEAMNAFSKVWPTDSFHHRAGQ